MHDAPFEFLKRMVAERGWYEPGKTRIIELGGRHWSGPLVRQAFPDPGAYLAVDRMAGPEVNLQWDFDHLPEAFNGKFDVAVTTSTLEHLPNVRDVLYALIRVVRPGGVVLVTTVTKDWPEHDGGTDFYRNIDPAEVTETLDPLCSESLIETPGNELFYWGRLKLYPTT